MGTKIGESAVEVLKTPRDIKVVSPVVKSQSQPVNMGTSKEGEQTVPHAPEDSIHHLNEKVPVILLLDYKFHIVTVFHMKFYEALAVRCQLRNCYLKS